jgi:hypothetical protein
VHRPAVHVEEDGDAFVVEGERVAVPGELRMVDGDPLRGRHRLCVTGCGGITGGGQRPLPAAEREEQEEGWSETGRGFGRLHAGASWGPPREVVKMLRAANVMKW